MDKSFTSGKNQKSQGITPSVALINPKHERNVGAALRACSCFGAKQLWWTGDRVNLDATKKRLPREERMKGFRDVELRQHDYPFEHFPKATPVAIEVRENSEMLTDFIHPENALYVFGPEDGSLSKVHLQHCHKFVIIPTRHCTNLAAAVYIVLYDRLLKQCQNGELNAYEQTPGIVEGRGWSEYEIQESFG